MSAGKDTQCARGNNQNRRRRPLRVIADASITMARFGKKILAGEMHAPDAIEGCAYEAERAARIARNVERMKALGIVDATRALTQSANAERLAKRHSRACDGASRAGKIEPKPRPRVTRRSGRLSGAAPGEPTAFDALPPDLRDEPDRNPEVYTEAHRAALGTASAPWTLFVDGYDTKGNRIYDPVRGATCHQCRQKTVCRHTSCGACGELRGQFCGDCLWMRYGENVDEAIAAGSAWTCPPCRDLCNCSFCRQRKGWPPTGTLYRRAIREGFASVAHYLVLNDAESEGAEVKKGAEVRKDAEEKENAEREDADVTRVPATPPQAPPRRETKRRRPWESSTETTVAERTRPWETKESLDARVLCG